MAMLVFSSPAILTGAEERKTGPSRFVEDFFKSFHPRISQIDAKLVVTTALILTFSPGEKGQRLQASLYAVVRQANPVAGAW
jgi:hypothetical protein